MKKKVIVYTVVFAVFISCCSACSVSEKVQNETSTYSQRTTEERTTSTVTDESSVNGSEESKNDERISSETDKIFRNASNSKPVVTINGRMITEFEYSIFEWQYDYANLSKKEMRERIISSVLISQQVKRMNLVITENSKKQVEPIINWLRGESSFSSVESVERYKISKKELVDIYEDVMKIHAANWDFEGLFYDKLVDGTLGEIDASLQEACDEYQRIQVDVDTFKVSYKRLEDCYQKTLNNYIDLLKDRSEIVYGNK